MGWPWQRRQLSLPPLIENCPRCRGTGRDPEMMDEDEIDYSDCIQCHGVARRLTDAGRAVCEAISIADAIVDAQLDVRYGVDNPNDPRRLTRK